MNADYNNNDIAIGDMVMIVSTTDDPDNAKIYVKTETAFSFLIDLSGAAGIQGPQGERGAAFTYNDFTAE